MNSRLENCYLVENKETYLRSRNKRKETNNNNPRGCSASIHPRESQTPSQNPMVVIRRNAAQQKPTPTFKIRPDRYTKTNPTVETFPESLAHRSLIKIQNALEKSRFVLPYKKRHGETTMETAVVTLPWT